MHARYIQYGASLTAEMNLASGASCPSASPSGQRMPCILGSGGGPAIRMGYRSPGPWYIGGAYEFVKMDSSNLYRLGIFQQLRAEMRYLPDTSYRASPYVSWGIGAVGYGSEWGFETGGGVLSLGGGVEIEASRLAVVGVALSYRPALIVGWTDTANFTRPTGVAHFIALELILEARGQLGRR